MKVPHFFVMREQRVNLKEEKMEFYIHIVVQSDVDKDQQDKEWPPKKQERIAT